MEIAIIISTILFIIGLMVMLVAILLDSQDWIFEAGAIIAIISLFATISFALCRNSVIKKSIPKEYPASEYYFKIKVVEFEEQRDTILVVIPKKN